METNDVNKAALSVDVSRLVSPAVVRGRAMLAAILLLLQAVALVAISGDTGWRAIAQLDTLVAFSIGIAAGISMGRSTKGWG